MVIHDEDEVYVCWNVIKLARHPLALRTRNLVEGTVKDKHQYVGDPNRVETAAFQIWEPLKVIAQSSLLISVQVMISQRRINRDLPLAPYAGFCIPDFPVFRVVAVVNDVPSETDEGGIRVGDGLHQCATDRRIGSFGVIWIVKTRIPVGGELEGRFQAQGQVDS